MGTNPAETPTRGERLLSRDGERLFATRIARLFAYVFLSVVLVLYLVSAGVSEARVGLLLTLTLLGETVISLALTTGADRIGLVNTMVFTHLPSNVLRLLVPLMPTLPLAVGVLLLRFSISQMDGPTRQSYTMADVSPDERSAAAGITGVARTTGAGLSPIMAGPLLASPALMGVPFFLAGGLKIVYDLLLWRSFRRVGENQAPEALTG